VGMYYDAEYKYFEWSDFFYYYPDAMNSEFLDKYLDDLDKHAWIYITHELDLNKVDLKKFQKYLNWKYISKRPLTEEMIKDNKHYIDWTILEKFNKNINKEFIQRHKPKKFCGRVFD